MSYVNFFWAYEGKNIDWFLRDLRERPECYMVFVLCSCQNKNKHRKRKLFFILHQFGLLWLWNNHLPNSISRLRLLWFDLWWSPYYVRCMVVNGLSEVTFILNIGLLNNFTSTQTLSWVIQFSQLILFFIAFFQNTCKVTPIHMSWNVNQVR